MKKIIAILIILLTISSLSLAVDQEEIVDVTPPWGRITVANAVEINNINYVSTTSIEVELYVHDDICSDDEIEYYLSFEKIPTDTEIEDSEWQKYTTGKKVTLTLPNTVSTNVLYGIFRDKTGNTSLIYTSGQAEYTLTYDLNGGTGEIAGGKGYFGMPYVVTNLMPEKEGEYFLGWSLSSQSTVASYRQGDIIPASNFKGINKDITLYAVWTDDINVLPNLSDMVKVGDYVDYPVYYENVRAGGDLSKYKGWRVISKDINLDGEVETGTVNLVSAGCPLTFKHGSNSSTAVTALTTNFLYTAFDAIEDYKYRQNGFCGYHDLKEAFTNKYTSMNGDEPKVRAMFGEDILRVTGDTKLTYALSFSAEKYENLFKIDVSYWLASPYSSSTLWLVYRDGSVSYNTYGEYGVRPVVSLKSNVKTTGKDVIGRWKLEIAQR